MSDWKAFLDDGERAAVARTEARIKENRAYRKRMMNRAYTRMRRENERSAAIRDISKRIAAE